MALSIIYQPSKKNLNENTRIYLYETFRDPVTKKVIKKFVKTVGKYGELIKDNPNFLEELINHVKSINEEREDLVLEKENFIKIDTNDYYDPDLFNWGEAIFYPLWDKLGLHKALQTLSYRDKNLNNLELVTYALVTQRILYPQSKSSTYENLKDSVFDYSSIKFRHMYTALDQLDKSKDFIIKKINDSLDTMFERDISLALYDVTTFYFESFYESDLKEEDCASFSDYIRGIPTEDNKRSDRNLLHHGMSKDNKRYESQVVLGLLVDADGIPITYELFKGNIAETHTLIEIVNKFQKDYKIKDVIVVADAGLNNPNNIAQLDKAGLKYIVSYPPYMKFSEKAGQELRSELGWTYVSDSVNKEFKYKVLDNHKIGSGKYKDLNITTRFICYFSSSIKTKRLREIDNKTTKALNKIQKNQVGGSKDVYITYTKPVKDKINKTKEAIYCINQKLIDKQIAWAGYTGIITNVIDRDPLEIQRIKRQLWQIENNFRTMKTNLQARPVYHQNDSRIRGHFMVCYIALVMTRLLEKLIKDNNINTSVQEFINSIKLQTVTPIKESNGNIRLTFIKPYSKDLNDKFNTVSSLLKVPSLEGLYTVTEFSKSVKTILNIDSAKLDIFNEESNKKIKIEYSESIQTFSESIDLIESNYM